MVWCGTQTCKSFQEPSTNLGSYVEGRGTGSGFGRTFSGENGRSLQDDEKALVHLFSIPFRVQIFLRISQTTHLCGGVRILFELRYLLYTTLRCDTDLQIFDPRKVAVKNLDIYDESTYTKEDKKASHLVTMVQAMRGLTHWKGGRRDGLECGGNDLPVAQRTVPHLEEGVYLLAVLRKRKIEKFKSLYTPQNLFLEKWHRALELLPTSPSGAQPFVILTVGGDGI